MKLLTIHNRHVEQVENEKEGAVQDLSIKLARTEENSNAIRDLLKNAEIELEKLTDANFHNKKQHDLITEVLRSENKGLKKLVAKQNLEQIEDRGKYISKI